MKHRSLFGQLATQFSVSPENLATEALNHILSTSKTAKEAFAEHLNQLGLSIVAKVNVVGHHVQF